jgi:lysophospholipase L1-like esterase
MRMICSGTNPISCHFGGSPGDYAVTLDLGGSAAAYTEIQAEMNRAMLKPLTTTAGARKEFSFVVNVRTPEGQPVEDGPTEGTPGLDLYFYGSQGGPGETAAAGGTVAPLLDAVGYATPATGRVGLFVAGDSTVCDQTDADYAGWAQLIPASFNYPISIANYADSGESALSFYASGALWKAMLAQVKSGDWVFIQFGHNDKTDATGQFQTAITNMVTQAKNKGAHPVLISPPARATYSGQTLSAQFVYDWGSVQPVMQQVATAQQIPYIDLTSITTTWYNQLGPNGWQAYHALGTDRTHTNRAGASAIADFVVAAIKSQNIGLTQYLR